MSKEVGIIRAKLTALELRIESEIARSEREGTKYHQPTLRALFSQSRRLHDRLLMLERFW